MEILIGCDPEVFVEKDGKLISGYGLLPGTKHEPHTVKGGAVQVDGMALEFNIIPCKNYKEFVGRIETVMGEMHTMLGPDYKLVIDPTAMFGKEYIDAQPDEAKVLGCDPDFSAYTMAPNPRPNGDLGFRTASGHIHIGWTKDMDPMDEGHFEACAMLTRQLDASIAVMSKIWDNDTTRREMYGKLGTFRPKPYGMEYRVLSNAWLRYPWLQQLVFTAASHATKQLLKGVKWYEKVNYLSDFEDGTIIGLGKAHQYFSGRSGCHDQEIIDGMYSLLNKEKEVLKKTLQLSPSVHYPFTPVTFDFPNVVFAK